MPDVQKAELNMKEVADAINEAKRRKELGEHCLCPLTVQWCTTKDKLVPSACRLNMCTYVHAYFVCKLCNMLCTTSTIPIHSYHCQVSLIHCSHKHCLSIPPRHFLQSVCSCPCSTSDSSSLCLSHNLNAVQLSVILTRPTRH